MMYRGSHAVSPAGSHRLLLGMPKTDMDAQLDSSTVMIIETEVTLRKTSFDVLF